jgi:hypothetical protein
MHKNSIFQYSSVWGNVIMPIQQSRARVKGGSFTWILGYKSMAFFSTTSLAWLMVDLRRGVSIRGVSYW